MDKKTDRIFYWPQEGTTGFWGLRGCLEEPEFKQDHPLHSPSLWFSYYEALESCKSNKLQIVNPEVIPNVPLWPGDIFDLPIGYEFKEELQQVSSTSHINPQWIEVSEEQAKQYPGFATRKVLRLVKTETKDFEWKDDMPLFDRKIEVAFPQPEPEESQTPIFDEMLRKYFDYRYHREMSGHQACAELQKEFIIQRKKQ